MSEYKTADELLEAQQEAMKEYVDKEIREVEARFSAGRDMVGTYEARVAEHFDRIGLQVSEGYRYTYIIYATRKRQKQSWIKKLFSRG